MTAMRRARELIGVIPAAGRGTRLGPLPMSKELYPIAVHLGDRTTDRRVRVASEYLIEALRQGGARKAFIVLRPGKWDIPAFLGDGSSLRMPLAYLTVHVPFGVPFSLDQAFPFIENANILLGFPDILFMPTSAFLTLIDELKARPADVVLGLFRTDEPYRVGVVDFSPQGWVNRIHEKSQVTHLEYMWAIAAWKPAFTAFLHQAVQHRLAAIPRSTLNGNFDSNSDYSELSLSDVMQEAITEGLRIAAYCIKGGRYIDIGTPESLAKAVSPANCWTLAAK